MFLDDRHSDNSSGLKEARSVPFAREREGNVQPTSWPERNLTFLGQPLKETPLKTSKLFLAASWMMMALCFAGCKDSARKFGELSALAGDTTDKGLSGHGFTEIYERFFYPLKYEPIKIFEIGIEWGGSLRLWERYFPKASVYGIDIVDKSSMDSKRIHTLVADQADRDQLKHFIRTYGNAYDIILDDGGHAMDQQQISFGFLFPYLKPGGYYIIEDVHSSLLNYYRDLGLDYHVKDDETNTTLRMIQNFVETKKIESQYLRPEETRYLNRHIEYAVLFAKNSKRHSMTCIFKKVNE
jgi:hypothetical protein